MKSVCEKFLFSFLQKPTQVESIWVWGSECVCCASVLCVCVCVRLSLQTREPVWKAAVLTQRVWESHLQRGALWIIPPGWLIRCEGVMTAAPVITAQRGAERRWSVYNHWSGIRSFVWALRETSLQRRRSNCAVQFTRVTKSLTESLTVLHLGLCFVPNSGLTSQISPLVGNLVMIMMVRGILRLRRKYCQW